MNCRSKKITLLAFVAFVTTSLVACSNSGFSSSSTTSTSSSSTGTTTTTTTSSGSCSSSNTVFVTDYYPGLSNIYATVNLFSSGDKRYYGNVTLNYTAGGYNYAANYNAPAGNNISLDGLYDNGTETATFNYFYNNGQYFSGFFQNSVGALVVSVTNVQNGCASGNIYFMNFVQDGAIQSPYRECWFIYAGPYNCRDSNIINKTSVQPGGAYQLIGTFTGLPVNTAFQ